MDEELLRFIIENDKIDLQNVVSEMNMKKKQDLLKQHPYERWQGTNGKWYVHIPDKRHPDGRRKIKRNTEEEIIDAIVAYQKSEENSPTIEEVFTEWNNRRLSLGKIARSTHERNICFFERHYSVMGKRKIRSITASEMSDFLEEQIYEHDLNAKAFSNLKTITRGMLKRAKKLGLIDFSVELMFEDMDVSDRDFRKSNKKEQDEVFTDEEYLEMMNYLKSHEDSYNLAIMLLFVTGIRVGELVALKRTDFKSDLVFEVNKTETRFRNEENKFVTAIKDFPKTQAGIRNVVIPREYLWLAKKVKNLNPFGEFIFIRKDGHRMQTEDVRHRLYLNCEKLGFDRIKSPHTIRKTYGSILLDSHVSEKIVERQMGHTTIETTRKYYYKDRKNTEEKIDVISDLDIFKTALM